MNDEKLKKSFQLVKEDISDLYNRLDDLTEKVDEILVTQRTLADKIVKKADKKAVRKIAKKSVSKKNKKITKKKKRR